jgi:glycosyltransferase involved in cell wall biosynthesis
MKLAFFHPALQRVGGSEVLASMQARQLSAQGDEISFVTFAFDRRRWLTTFEGIDVEVVRKRNWTELFTFWSPEIKARDRGRRALRVLEGHDAVLAHNRPCGAIVGSSSLPLLKAWYCHEPPRALYPREANPYLAAAAESGAGESAAEFRELVHRWAAEWNPRHEAWKAFDQSGVAGLDLIIANSEFCRDNARRVYRRDDIEVVHPMVRFGPNPPGRHGIDRTGLKVLVHTRLEQLKNVGTVLRGFARFRARAGSGCRLHVVGEGSHREALERLAAKLGLRDEVRFHGFLPDAKLAEIYAACDVFALLPLDEPFGLVFPEAMTRGLLAVGPSHGGPVEILDDGRFGWTCEALDPEAVADAFMRIWRSPDAELDRRRIDADRACRQRFSPEVVGAHLQELLRAHDGSCRGHRRSARRGRPDSVRSEGMSGGLGALAKTSI